MTVHHKNTALKTMESFDPKRISTFFKIMSEEIRFKLTFILAYEGEMCVSDLAKCTETSISTTSHHLQILKKNEIIESRREGKQIFYFIQNKRVLHFIKIGLDFSDLPK